MTGRGQQYRRSTGTNPRKKSKVIDSRSSTKKRKRTTESQEKKQSKKSESVLNDVKIPRIPRSTEACGPTYWEIKDKDVSYELFPTTLLARGQQKSVFRMARRRRQDSVAEEVPLVWQCSRIVDRDEVVGPDTRWTEWKRESHFAPWMGKQGIGPIVLQASPTFMITERMDMTATELGRQQAAVYMRERNEGILLFTEEQIQEMVDLIERMTLLGVVLGDMKLDNIGVIRRSNGRVEFRILDYGMAGYISGLSPDPLFGWTHVFGCPGQKPVPEPLRPFLNLMQWAQSVNGFPIVFVKSQSGVFRWDDQSVEDWIPDWTAFSNACQEPRRRPLLGAHKAIRDQYFPSFSIYRPKLKPGMVVKT